MGSIMDTMKAFSTPHHRLKAMSSEQPLGTVKATGTHTPRTEKGVKESPSAWVQLMSQLAVMSFQ